jgi:hypothetical protein
MAQRLLTGDTYLNYNYGQRGRKLWYFTLGQDK